jgi:hypothetical protein
MRRTLRVALAGAAAAGIWAAVDPALRRGCRTRYGEVRLVGRLIAPTRWQPVGLAVHLMNGALFAVAFDRLGGRGVRQAVIAAELENAALWPCLAVVDRLHPDVRDGTWSPILRDPRVLVQEVAGHALFGVALGLLVPAAR